MLPEGAVDTPADFPESLKHLTSYYLNRVPHPRAPNTCLPRSWDLMANVAFAYNEMTAPRPLLMITDTKARDEVVF